MLSIALVLRFRNINRWKTYFKLFWFRFW